MKLMGTEEEGVLDDDEEEEEREKGNGEGARRRREEGMPWTWENT